MDACKHLNIGIAISTHNRNEVCNNTLNRVLDHSKGCKVVVVDDASDIPFYRADFRFENQAGIPKTKNKCIELLDGCDWVILLDDDCFPIVDNWYLPYVNSGINHLCFTFSKLHHGGTNGNRILLKSENGLNIYQNPNGCAMFIKRICIDTIGGFDERFMVYSYDHVNLSQRIYNAGLTPYPFMDVANSLDLLHSMDYFNEVKSSVEPLKRAGFIKHNRPIYQSESLSKEFIRYK